jgi:1,4-alpha-glucan branching enzyme
MSFVRRDRQQSSVLLIILNLTPVLRDGYRIGLPLGGRWLELLNSDAGIYGGSNAGNLGAVEAQPWGVHNQPCSAHVSSPTSQRHGLQMREAPGRSLKWIQHAGANVSR